MAEKLFVGSKSSLWATEENWSPKGVPTSSDDVEFNAASPTVDLGSAARSCRSLNCEQYEKEIKFKNILNIGTSTTVESGGMKNTAMKLGSKMKWNAESGAELKFISTSATIQKVFTAGVTMPLTIFKGIGGSWIFEEEFNSSTALEALQGLIKTNSKNVTATRILHGVSKMEIDFGESASILKLTGTELLFPPPGAENFTAENTKNVTLEITNETSTEKRIENGSVIEANRIMFANIKVIGDNVQLRVNLGSTNLYLNNAGLPNGTKGTGVSESEVAFLLTNLFTNATSGSHAKLASIKLKKTSGTVNTNYLNLKKTFVEGGATWYAGNGSTDEGENTGWKFSTPFEFAAVSISSKFLVTAPLALPVRIKSEDKFVSTVAALLKVVPQVSSTISSPSKFSASLTTAIRLKANVSSASKINATLQVQEDLFAKLESVSTLIGGLITPPKVSSTITSKSELVSYIRTGVPLHAGVASNSSLSASLITPPKIFAIIVSSSKLFGSLIIHEAWNAKLESQFTSSAKMVVAVKLSSEGKLVSQLLASKIRVGAKMGSSILSNSSLSSILIVNPKLSSKMVSVSQLNALLKILPSLHGNIVSYAELAGGLEIQSHATHNRLAMIL